MATTSNKRLTPEQKERAALAKKIIELRAKGLRWDGENGICEQTGIKTAMVGRRLMREWGAGEQVKPLTGKRLAQQQEAQERRQREIQEARARREAKATDTTKAAS